MNIRALCLRAFAVTGRIPKHNSVTFAWFLLNRYFPLRKGDLAT